MTTAAAAGNISRVLLLGPPGAGKGTQAKRLAKKLAVPQISTGEMLRAAVAEGSAVGKRAQAAMDEGVLVSDELVLEIIGERLQAEDAQRGFIFDGFPRTAPQAEALDALLAERGAELQRALAIEVSEQELVARILKRAQTEARGDDNEGAIRIRMREYRSKTEPLAAYYRRQGKLAAIDGQAPPEVVAGRIAEALQ